MTRAEVVERIVRVGIVGIIRLPRPDGAVAAARALVEGGIGVVEFTMTMPGALDALAAARGELGSGAVLGVGTVLDERMAREAYLAGAEFIVTPILAPDVITFCRTRDVPVMPGALSPTEVFRAWEQGGDLVKVFPAGPLGPAYIRDLLGPLPQVRLVPTGGVSAENAAAFIQAGAAAVAAGGSLADPALVGQGDFAGITARAGALVAAVADGRQGR